MLRKINNKLPRLGRGRSDRRGATAVEFAWVAPIFMMVVAVCIEFSRMSILRNVAQNACYETCRFAMAEGAVLNDGFTRANQILDRLGNVNADIFINDQNSPDGEELEFDTPEISVRIEIPLSQNTLILPGAWLGDNKITAQTTMRTERYRGFFDSTLAD
jgi:hypothetical protein